jgi:hypothetical protein
MPSLISSESPTDVDNEATAELPVLDVAAYESTLAEHTDNWVIPRVATAPAEPNAVDATAQMPAMKGNAIPTLPAYDIDHSGTHEMPQPSRIQLTRRENSQAKRSKKAARRAETPNPAKAKATATPEPAPASEPAPVATRPSVHVAAPIVVPPSPPLIEELRHALALAERRIEELNARAHIADTERLVAVARVNAENNQLREQLAVHLESLHTSKERLGVMRADLPELEDEVFARGDRIAALERELATVRVTLAEREARLDKRDQRSELLEGEVRNLKASIGRRDSQIAALEADLAARQQREALLNSRLSDALASTDPFVPQLRGELAARDEQLRLLKLDLELARTHAAEKDQDLQVAEENIRNLEIEVRDKTGKLEEANVTVEEWRAVIAESQRSILERDGRIQQLQSDLEKRASAANDSAAQTGEEIALEGPARVLIRTDGNTDFVHVLGRRTRIGRGPDNELVLDTKHVSRYHAVLLAGPTHTQIEDLNSTNGVFVNGKRVSRQALKDGDRVTVGRTQFRYTVRD